MSTDAGDNETEKASETNATVPDASIKSESKDDIEERYNKLRGFAVKLKKKVSDLTEELKNLENEKQKITAEKDELHNKIAQISDNAKTLQRLQLEYDKVQDTLEKERADNKKISKNLETVVLENASLKESRYEDKENLERLKNELERRAKEIASLESNLKNQQSSAKKIIEEKKAESLIKEQKEKEIEELKSKLEAEIQSHEATKAQLDAAKQECTSNNVLSLEVDNYERSVEDLKSKLDEEVSKRSILEKTIEEHLETITSLENELQELRDNCLAKTNQITILSDKNETLKAELCNKRDEIARTTDEVRALLESLESAKRENIKLYKDMERSEAEKSRAEESLKLQNKNHAQQTKTMEAELATLTDLVASTSQELEALRQEYTGYKLRAQSVLRTKQSQSKESGSSGRSVAEIEEELEHSRNHAVQLQEKLESCRENLKMLTKEVNFIKEDRDRTFEKSQDLANKLSTLAQDYTTLRDQHRTQTSMMEKQRIELSTKIDSLEKRHENEMAELEARHRKEVSRLEMERQKALASTGLVENSQPKNSHHERQHEIKSENDSQSRSTEILLQEREDGEGSESVDSYPTGLTNQEMSRRHSLVPLDELLNSSDDLMKPRQVPAPSRKVDRQELELCERRVKHLTVLLADTERDVAKLTQLNQLLKEDIRRQQRSAEREHLANNFEYMKNVILKFVTLKNGDERSRLIPVLNTILKLSPEETNQLNHIAGVGRGWLPAIPIPGWHNG